MAISYPYDLLAGFPGWSTEFDLLWRQEQSRQANGRTIVKDFGSPLWRATYQTKTLSANELDAWRARLAAMENGLKTFFGRPLSRCRPINHPGSDALPGGTLLNVDVDGKTVRIDGLAGITLHVGDMIQIRAADLHQVVDISGSDIEVRPHLWPGAGIGAAVVIARPACIMAVVPGSISTSADLATGRGSVSFQAIEAR